MSTHPDLTIRGESVQRIYDFYIGRRFLVNRRYQRKLIWTVEEKRALIDSIKRGYPLPLILLGDVEKDSDRFYEIIDGMQRLDAIFSFVENSFAVDDCYFDLDTIAETKLKKDKGELKQKTPIMDRDVCKQIASYSVPLSSYRSPTPEQIDEIFRRINAGGRQLSKHDLRQAGTVSSFAAIVRRLAASVRGDSSHREVLPLNEMHKISITSRELDYGIDVDRIFWIEQNILTRDYVRKSRDEELIADLIAYMAIAGEKPASSSEILDDFFGLGEGGVENPRYQQVEAAVHRTTADVIERQFLAVHDVMREILKCADKKFNVLMFDDAGQRVPRYYQAVFLALHQLLVEENMRPRDVKQVAKKLDGIGKKFMDIGGGGGRWSAEERTKNISAVYGVVRPAFVKTRGSADPALSSWVTEFENLLSQSAIEQSAFDFKQGLFRIAASPSRDEVVLAKVVKTLAAMANAGPGETGYVLVGVADKKADADEIQRVFGVKPIARDGFWITGIEHEARLLGGEDQYFRWVVQKIKTQPVPLPFIDQISRDVRTIKYFDKSVLVFRVVGGEEPTAYDEVFSVRHGSSVDRVDARNMQQLFKRFMRK